jgi:hypothetical protein
MRKKNRLQSFLGIALLLAAASVLQAQGQFSGDFLFAFRFVNTSGPGADYKYKEDLNLRRGARLSSFNLSYAPENGLKKVFDRLDVRAFNLGGDPYETISVGLQKYGAYQIQYDRRKSAYFYQDLTRTDGGDLYDLFTFDFDRIQDSGTAKVWLRKEIGLYFDFNRYTKNGLSSTALDVERTEFEFDKPVREESREAAIGLDLRYGRYSVVLEEKFLDYRNENSYFLPGFADGGPDADYPSALYSFFMDQPYDLTGNRHSLRFAARPFDRLFVSGAGQIVNLDENLHYTESASGLNFLGRRLEYLDSGTGRFSRDMQLAQVDVQYLLRERFSLVGAFRYHNLDQTGEMTVNGEATAANFGFKTWGADVGAQYEFSPALVLTLGYRFEDRNLENLETVDFDLDTTQHGGFGNIRWDASRALKFTLDYEHSGYQNPYALISPTSANRLRMTARYRAGAANVSASYLWSSTESDLGTGDIIPFKTSRNQLSLRGGYHGDKVKAFAGFTYLQAKREGTRDVEYPPSFSGPGGSFLWDILYEGKGTVFDANLSFELTPGLSAGGYALLYNNTGSYEVSRTTLKAYLEYELTRGYVVQAGYRYVNFGEERGGFNDYKANIVELSFGYRWK